MLSDTPGQRLGLAVESLFLIASGTLVGVGWSVLGLYLSSLAYHHDVVGAYAVRAVFLAAAAGWHGYLRSSSPRLFFFVLLALIVSVVILLGTTTTVSIDTATQMLYPVLSAVVIVLLVNVAVFPEFSSGFLGTVTVETLSQTAATLREATAWFTEPVVPSAQLHGKPGEVEDHKQSPMTPCGRVHITEADPTP